MELVLIAPRKAHAAATSALAAVSALAPAWALVWLDSLPAVAAESCSLLAAVVHKNIVVGMGRGIVLAPQAVLPAAAEATDPSC